MDATKSFLDFGPRKANDSSSGNSGDWMMVEKKSKIL
jgi:hypothetical protein